MTVRRKAAQALALGFPAAQRGHVGLDPGLVDEHQSVRIEAICKLRQRCRRRATSARPCSRANSVFFEAETFASQESPYRMV